MKCAERKIPLCCQRPSIEEERGSEKNVSFPPPHLSPAGDVDRLPLWKHYSLTAPWQEFITAQPNVEIFSAKCQHM